MSGFFLWLTSCLSFFIPSTPQSKNRYQTLLELYV